jgi:KaiC/GvpD/RAD55 family RecA-like ATPase
LQKFLFLGGIFMLMQSSKSFDSKNKEHNHDSAHTKTEDKKLLFNFILESGINYIVGDSGIGKTLLSYYITIYLLQLGYYVVYIDINNPSGMPHHRGLDKKVLELNKRDSIKYFNFDDLFKAIEKNIVKDIEDFVLTLINYTEYYKQQNPDKRIVVILDTFQDLTRSMTAKKNIDIFLDKFKYHTQLGITYIILHYAPRTNINRLKGFADADMVYLIQSSKKEFHVGVTDFIMKAEKKCCRASNRFQIQILDNYKVKFNLHNFLRYQ